jgi:hypothetical protein
VVAPIDIDRLREERRRRIGHDMRRHLRSITYASVVDNPTGDGTFMLSQ